MDRFPKDYLKPKLINLHGASIRGWTASCNPVGDHPSSPGQLECSPTGSSFHAYDGDFLRNQGQQSGNTEIFGR